MHPNVIHNRCQNFAYILHILCIQLIFLCMVESAIRVHTFFHDVVHTHVSFPLQVAPIFWQISHCLVSHNQYFLKIRCGIFFQEPRHKLNEHWMAVFLVWCLSFLPLWVLISNTIFSWWRVRVRTLWNLDATRKEHFPYILPPWTLPWWVAQFSPVSWLFHCLGIVTRSNNLLRRTS